MTEPLIFDTINLINVDCKDMRKDKIQVDPLCSSLTAVRK